MELILNEHSDNTATLTAALDSFLNKTWSLINETALSYTAAPNAANLERYTEESAPPPSAPTMEAIKLAIHDIKQVLDRLNASHLQYMQNTLKHDNMKAELNDLCAKLARIIQMPLLPIQTERVLKSLVNQSENIAQITEQRHKTDSTPAERTREMKDSIQKIRPTDNEPTAKPDEAAGPIFNRS